MPEVLSVKQRLALGQDRRQQVRRVDHAKWDPKARTQDPLKLMAASMKGRVPDLVELKYNLMAAAPFAYFRGAVPVMAYDLSLVENTGIISQLCGDAHVRNLGAFAAPDGRLVFDINDYDETIPGPFEWDVKRMATSIMLAGRNASIKEAGCREAAAVFLESYRTSMMQFSRMGVLETARFLVHRLKSVAPVGGILRMAERATPLHTLESLTEVKPDPAPRGKAQRAKEQGGKEQGGKEKERQAGKGHHRKAARESAPASRDRIFKTIPPTLTRVSEETAKKVVASLASYERNLEKQRKHFLCQYRVKDVAFKVVGTGSVGLRDYCIYMEGNGPGDPLFLQVKEEVESGWAPYLHKVRGLHRPQSKQHQGKRVVEGERAMQIQSDVFIGWTTFEGRDYLVRQLNDHKASLQLENLKAGGAMEYAAVCGEILARGHARSGDPCLLAGYLGNSMRFDDAIVDFAVRYADQTEDDWHQLVQSRRAAPKKTAAKTAGKTPNAIAGKTDAKSPSAPPAKKRTKSK
jgi:uncharacterized protein (DUF2252 family)